MVNPGLGVRSLEELLALLKTRGEALPYVSPGPGTIGNLIAEFWAEKEGVRLAHVAYKGAGQAVTDLVGGHVLMGAMTWTAALGQMQAKTVIPLAVSSERRMGGFADVPTLKELGYADLAVTTWFGFAAPAGLPRPIGLRMNQEIEARRCAIACSPRVSSSKKCHPTRSPRSSARDLHAGDRSPGA